MRISRIRTLASSMTLASAGLLGICPAALAQSSDTATAESMFEQGRDLLRAGNAKEACPKLAESQRLDPATGTLLALAMCHEADGKLASAWAAFIDVETRSRNENRADRQQVAHDRATALRPRLSTLEIRVPANLVGLAGLEVRRDGVALGRGAWNLALPVDGAEHVVEVLAPGKLTWKGSIPVKTETDVAVIEVPLLKDAPIPPKAADTGPAPTQPHRLGTLEWAGIGTAGAGVVVLGVSGFFLASALGKKTDSNADCAGSACGTTGFDDRQSAISKGNTASILAIAGGALVAGGTTLFVIGWTKKSSGETTAPSGVKLNAGLGSLGASYATSF
jgi:hypothetical protein